MQVCLASSTSHPLTAALTELPQQLRMDAQSLVSGGLHTAAFTTVPDLASTSNHQ